MCAARTLLLLLPILVTAASPAYSSPSIPPLIRTQREKAMVNNSASLTNAHLASFWNPNVKEMSRLSRSNVTPISSMNYVCLD